MKETMFIFWLMLSPLMIEAQDFRKYLLIIIFFIAMWVVNFLYLYSRLLLTDLGNEAHEKSCIETE